MEAATLGLAGVAGVLSSLSPCVLPLLPLVLGAAATGHRLGPAALAGGLALSFTTIGLFIATIGFSIGLDADLFRRIGAVLLIAFGLALVVPRVQEQVVIAAGPVSNWAHTRTASFSPQGLGGQFLLGLILGVVWTPCVGPTLGATMVLAAQGTNLGAVGLTMLVFGLGAAVPLLVIGALSREAMIRWRGRFSSAGWAGKAALGGVLLGMGLLLFTGYDKSVQTFLVDASPEWLTRLTTRY